jgi:hypothetical protein
MACAATHAPATSLAPVLAAVVLVRWLRGLDAGGLRLVLAGERWSVAPAGAPGSARGAPLSVAPRCRAVFENLLCLELRFRCGEASGPGHVLIWRDMLPERDWRSLRRSLTLHGGP